MQRLFALTVSKSAQAIRPILFEKEEGLHRIVSANLMTFFGASLLADEWKVGPSDSRIDTIGIQNDCPIIIEYKKGKDYNVVNQILSYYHDLTDYGSEFRWLVTQKLGKEQAEKIKLNKVRLVCVAKEFAKFDLKSWRSHQNVELVTYRYFDNNTLLFEWVAGKSPAMPEQHPVNLKPLQPKPVKPGKKGRMRAFVAKSDPVRRGIFDLLCQRVEALAPIGITDFDGEQYIAYKKDGKNFVFIRAYPLKNLIRFSVNLDAGKENLDGRICKKGSIGGNGKILADLATEEDLRKAFPLIEKAYRLR